MGDRRGPGAPELVANALVAGVAVLAAAFVAWRPEAYYLAVQEDETLEWATFWAFAAAAGVLAWQTRRLARAAPWRAWFPLGVAACCLVVALEEISWGQRIFGYRPPSYFLAHNYQQELNLHNVLAKDLRRLGLEAVILGWGVALPLLGRVPAVARRFARLGVVTAPLSLAPAFALAWALYELYPWDFTGEWVELMLGLGFLLSALLLPVPGSSGPPTGRALAGLALACVAVAGAGEASAAWSRAQRRAHPEALAAARTEVEALAADLRDAGVRTGCGLHRRLFTLVQQGHAAALTRGRFAALEAQGLPEERSRFFLDPWNTAYWVRDACGADRRQRRIAVYSFGPNRMRDSSEWELGGDDVGALVFESAPGS